MPSTCISRRALCYRLAAIPIGLGAAARARPTAGNGLLHTSETIHQEVMFNAGRHRVFAALTDSAQFDAITRLSDAVKLVTAPGAKPTSISREAGSEFTLFGGYITGRNLESLPDERLVQAWRGASLADGWHVHYWRPLAKYLLRA